MTTRDKKEAKEVLKVASDVAEEMLKSAATNASSLLKDSAKQLMDIALIAQDISYVRKDLAEIKTKLESDYVTKDQFLPVQKIAFGMVGVLGIATLGAIARLIFIK